MRGIALAAALSFAALSCGPTASTRETVTKATVDGWMEQLSNWGRWGSDDQIGTVNLITPQKRKLAAALVTDGEPVSLARTAEQTEAEDNPRPFGHRMLNMGDNPAAGQFVSDEYTVAFHGYAHTHMDALAHMSYQGKSYNGVEMANVDADGAPKLAVTNFKDGIFTKGILLDIPYLKGVDWLEPGTAIYPEDLDAFERKTGVKVEPGDVVFVYTGRWKLRDAKGPWNAAESAAGLHASTAPWLHARDIAMLGSDAASDVAPSGVEGVRQPIHQLMLVAMGTPIFDNCDLEALAAECRKRNRWDFLLTAAPIPVGEGTGSPINPTAVF
ncbi:MAG: cyclase family protein [Bryobacterales bacterium]